VTWWPTDHEEMHVKYDESVYAAMEQDSELGIYQSNAKTLAALPFLHLPLHFVHTGHTHFTNARLHNKISYACSCFLVY
jgi:hypothetical protein